MIYLSAQNLQEATLLLSQNPTFTLLHGGTDLALRLQHSTIDGIIDISHITELDYITKESEYIEIGALTSINTIIDNVDISKNIAILTKACQSFASYQIRNVASLGGNIVNASPVADLIAPLLVLNTKIKLKSINTERIILLEDFFQAYKSLDMHHEILVSFTVPIQEHQYYYRKVGARATLNISKVSLAMIQNDEGFFISGASVNPYVSRFKHLEALLNNNVREKTLLEEALHQDIKPSGSFRSTKEYRYRVLINMIHEALEAFRK